MKKISTLFKIVGTVRHSFSKTFMNLEMPIITVIKYDEKTGAKLPNAQFAIYEQADESRPVAEGLTDVDTFEEEQAIDIDEVKANIKNIESELVGVQAQMKKYLEQLGL